jgi:HSP20 family protein
MYPSLPRFPTDLFAEFDRMQRQLQHWTGRSGWPSSIRSAAGDAFPAINVGNTAETVEVYAFAPGLDPSKLEVTVDKGLLVIAGERSAGLPEGNQKVSVYARERFAGRFRRVVSLPEEVDPQQVEANYRNGILRVVVQKRELSKPRRIDVK